MIKKHIAPIIYFLLAVGFCGYLAHESWGHSVAYEHRISSLSERLTMSDNFKTKMKAFWETVTFSWYSGHSEDLEALTALKEQAELDEQTAYKYTKLFIATLVLMFLIHHFLMQRSSLGQWSLLGLLVVTVTALVTGWFAPILAIVAYQDIPVLGQTVFQYESKSIVSALLKLYESGQVAISVVIFVFTILTPVLKSVVMLVVMFSTNLHFSKRSIKILKTIGKWSMLDVFVIAILVTYFTTKSGGSTDATLHIGVYYFVTYVVASMLLTYLVNIRTPRQQS